MSGSSEAGIALPSKVIEHALPFSPLPMEDALSMIPPVIVIEPPAPFTPPPIPAASLPKES